MHEPGPCVLRTDDKLRWKDDFVMYYEVERGGMVDLEALYMHMYHWFIKEQFGHWADGTKEVEDFYLHRVRQDGVQENLIWWRAYKKPSNSDYVCYFCKMDWQNFGSKATEIMYKDKKIKTNKIGLVIRVWWWVQIDPYNKWEKTWLGSLWGGKFPRWFYEYMLHYEMEYHRDKAKRIAERQQNELRQFFEMTTSEAMPRSFFPESGYKWEKPKADPADFSNKPRKPDAQI